MAEISDEKSAPLLRSPSDQLEVEFEETAAEEETVPFSSIEKAAYLVDQALARHLMPLEVLKHQHYARAKRAYEMYTSLFFVRCAAMGILTFMPFFEEPEWCSKIRPNGHCDQTAKYMLSGITYLHPWASALVKFLCMAPLSVSLILQHYYKFLTFWRERSTWIKVGLMIAMALHLVTSVPQVPWLFIDQSRLMGMYLCILIPLIFSRSLRNCFKMTMCLGHSFIDTAGLLIIFILISAWLANKLFHSPNFEDFPQALLSLFVMLTTANNPNVWVETYERNHYSFFFFFAYMAITYFFLMQLLFVLIYNSYKVQLSKECQKHTSTRTRNLRAAFDLLNLHREGICIENANTLFFQIGIYRHVQDLSQIVEEVLADFKNREEEKIIFGEFQTLCVNFVKSVESKLQDLSTADHPQSPLGLYCSEDLLESWGYMVILFAATLASVAAAILDHHMRGSDFPGGSDPQSSSLKALTMFEFLLGWLCVIDLAFRMHVGGVQEFFQSVLNCFDFIATAGIISLQISTIWYPLAFNWYLAKHLHLQNTNAFNPRTYLVIGLLDALSVKETSNLFGPVPVLLCICGVMAVVSLYWIGVSILIRSMRYVSLLGYFSRWRFMGHLLIVMIPATAPILCFQFLVCSLFSVAGVHLFGGLVFVGNSRLDATEYADSGLWVYNYNDYASAVVTSFNLCVVNNWYVIMDGYAAATQSNWSRAYFIAFWAIAATYTLNVVVAFFVGAFTTQMEKAEHAHSLYSLAPASSKKSMLARTRLSATLFMGYNGAFSKYDLYEEIVKS